MTFALLHAALGWALALLVCAALRRRAASARCWAWRLGLLKGPLALALAVPVAVSMNPSPLWGRGGAAEGWGEAASQVDGGRGVPREAPVFETLSKTHRTDKSYRTYKTYPSYDTAALAPTPPRPSAQRPFAPLPPLYVAGVAAVVLARLLAARRAHAGMPRVEGVLRPRVVVPPGLAPETAAMALAHEQAHVRRRDPQWSLVADLVCAALWFAPPVWLCARGMRAEAEAACDAEALRATGAARKRYARLLLSFAGPAPANALGGPARRLARRILMLDQAPKPLPRAAALALLAVGALALLPWRAVASPQAADGPEKGPLQGAFARGVPPTRLPLDTAAGLMLEEPGVRAKVGWTADQDAQAKAAGDRWQTTMNLYRAEMGRRQKSGPLRDFFAWDAQARPQAFVQAEKAAGEPARTPEQTRLLKALALARFGSAVWKDPQIVARLRLTPAQLNAVTRENAAIGAAYRDETGDMRGRLLRPIPKMPAAVAARIKAVEAAYIAAPPEDRPPLLARLYNLKAPYEPVYRDRTPSEDNARLASALNRSWALRAAADRRLKAGLTEAQRATLRALTTDPSAWATTEGNRDMAFAPAAQSEPPARIALDAAIRGLLKEEGVLRRIGATPPQVRDLEIRIVLARSAAMQAEIAAAQARLQAAQGMSPAKRAQTQAALAAKRAAQARLRALGDGNTYQGSTILTPAQRARLRALALERFGGALWESLEIAQALGLRESQLATVRVENDRIQAYLDASGRRSELDPQIARLEVESGLKTLSEGRRQALQAQAARLRAVRDALKEYSRLPEEREQGAWRMRGAADERLRGLLDDAQRRALGALERP